MTKYEIIMAENSSVKWHLDRLYCKAYDMANKKNEEHNLILNDYERVNYLLETLFFDIVDICNELEKKESEKLASRYLDETFNLIKSIHSEYIDAIENNRYEESIKTTAEANINRITNKVHGLCLSMDDVDNFFSDRSSYEKVKQCIVFSDMNTNSRLFVNKDNECILYLPEIKDLNSALTCIYEISILIDIVDLKQNPLNLNDETISFLDHAGIMAKRRFVAEYLPTVKSRKNNINTNKKRKKSPYNK